MSQQITSFRGAYKFLSNFSSSLFQAAPYGVEIVNTEDEYSLKFPTVEHYFQASKAIRFTDAVTISKARTCRHAKTLGKNTILRTDWEEVKNDVMLAGLRYKFALPSFGRLLKATGDAELIEGNSWNDRYWGCSPVTDGDGNVTWVGENHLGRLLMVVRSELKKGE